jgi:molecular chaperone GrpE
MKNSRSERRQVPVTETAQPSEESPITVAPEMDGSDGNDDPTASLQADLDRFRDLALRSQADFDNYKKRATREKEEAVKYANSALLERLIAIADNFELGLSAARSEGAILVKQLPSRSNHHRACHEPNLWFGSQLAYDTP